MKLVIHVIFCALLLGVVVCQTPREKSLVLEKERVFLQAKYDDDRRSKSCTSLRKSRLKTPHSSDMIDIFTKVKGSRNKRATGERDALYFNGDQLLRLKLSKNRREVLLPAGEFTVEAWLKPEGGQQQRATIIGKVYLLFVKGCAMW